MDKMTIFFMKSSGKIKSVVTGIQDIGFYGDEKDDMSLIIDFIVVDFDQYVLNKPYEFIIDVQNNNKITLINAEEIRKYL